MKTARPLRVVVPALWYHPEHPSGSSHLAYDEARYLAALGHDVWLVAMHGGSGAPEHVLDGPLHVLRYRRPPWAAFDPMGSHERVVRRLLVRHVGAAVDLVHAHMLLPGAAAFAMYGASARTAYSLHSPVRAELQAASRGANSPERVRLRLAAALRSRLEGKLLARCDVVTCDSAFTRGLVRHIHGPAIAARCQVVPGWVDLSRFQVLEDRAAAKRSLGWPTDRPVLFSLRRLVPRMGLDTLIEAAARLRRHGRRFHLVIGGDGPLRHRLAAHAASLDLSDTVSFAGRVPDDRLPTMHGAADAFVLPTAELECFGLIAIEAMACGRPVLATPVGAIGEVVGRVEPRWLARSSGAEALAQLLEDFVDARLPVRDAFDLRRLVETSYAAPAVLPRLVSLVLGAASPSLTVEGV